MNAQEAIEIIEEQLKLMRAFPVQGTEEVVEALPILIESANVLHELVEGENEMIEISDEENEIFITNYGRLRVSQNVLKQIGVLE